MRSWYKTLRNFGIILKDFFWRMDSNERTMRSVQKYLRRNTRKTLRLVNEGHLPFDPMLFLNPDKCIRFIYDMVCQRWRWESDKKNYGKAEYWEDVDVAITRPGIDCETMATIVYCLCKIHRVNPLEMKFIVGTVEHPDGGSPNHVWLQYKSFIKGTEYIIDPAYSPGLKNFVEVGADPRYKSIEYETTIVKI